MGGDSFLFACRLVCVCSLVVLGRIRVFSVCIVETFFC